MCLFANLLWRKWKSIQTESISLSLSCCKSSSLTKTNSLMHSKTGGFMLLWNSFNIPQESYITTAGTKSISNLWVSLFQTHKKLLQLVQSQSLICSDLHELFQPHKHFIPMAFAFWVAIHLWNHLSPRRRNMWRKLLHPHLLCRWAILITAFIIEESCATLFIMPKPKWQHKIFWDCFKFEAAKSSNQWGKDWECLYTFYV